MQTFAAPSESFYRRKNKAVAIQKRKKPFPLLKAIQWPVAYSLQNAIHVPHNLQNVYGCRTPHKVTKVPACNKLLK